MAPIVVVAVSANGVLQLLLLLRSISDRYNIFQSYDWHTHESPNMIFIENVVAIVTIQTMHGIAQKNSL